MAIDIKQKTSKKKLFFLVAVVLVLAIGAGSALYVWQRPEPAPVISQPGGVVEITPPTQQEKDQADQQKEEVIKQQEIENTPSTDKKRVGVAIIYADQTTLNAEVSGVFEDGGVCTATFTQGNKKIQRTSQGVKNATTTSCAPMDFDPDFFASTGTWTLAVSYSSNTASGTSSSTNITVK